MNEDINKLIQSAIEERTLTLEAADAIAVLRKEHADLTSNNAALKRGLAEQGALNDKLYGELAVLGKELDGYKDMETVLLVREAKQLRLEIENEQMLIRIKDYKEMVLSLTRNLEYRSSMFGSKDEADQYGAIIPRSHNGTDTRTTE